MWINTVPPLDSSLGLVACTGLGNFTITLSCCTANNFTDPACHGTLSLLLQDGCPNRGSDCISSCSDSEWIYSSKIEDNGFGDGSGPRARYSACVNLPAIARASLNHVLPPNISSVVDKYVPRNTTEQQLEAVTAAVTDCLSSTCRNSRDGRDGLRSCYHEYCSPTTLLTNNTAPNIAAINNCIFKLCHQDDYGQLPYADDDVVGIGVCFPRPLTSGTFDAAI